MEVKGIRWVGVWTDRMSEMRAFVTDVLGLRVEGEDRSDFVELTMADGAKLELFGSAAALGIAMRDERLARERQSRSER